MDDIRFLLGSRIRVLRKRLKLSQEALALKAGLDRTYVASIENGNRNVSIVNIQRLATALECSLKDLFSTDEFAIIPDSALICKVAEKDSEIYE